MGDWAEALYEDGFADDFTALDDYDTFLGLHDFVPRSRSYHVTKCNRCKSTKVKWQTTAKGNWVLVNLDGSTHDCIAKSQGLDMTAISRLLAKRK